MEPNNNNIKTKLLRENSNANKFPKIKSTLVSSNNIKLITFMNLNYYLLLFILIFHVYMIIS